MKYSVERLDFKKATTNDLEILGMLRSSLWPNHTPKEMEEDARILLQNTHPIYKNNEFYIFYKDLELVGYIEFSLRTNTRFFENETIPFLEGWFVLEEYRNQRIGSYMIQTFKKWAKNHHYKKIGSDAEIDNKISIHAHLSNGFTIIGTTEEEVTFLMEI